MNRRRGGDHWYNARTNSLCFRVAAVVHARGEATTHDVATACGLPMPQAYHALIACCRRAHLYHLTRRRPGCFMGMPPGTVAAKRPAGRSAAPERDQGSGSW